MPSSIEFTHTYMGKFIYDKHMAALSAETLAVLMDDHKKKSFRLETPSSAISVIDRRKRRV